MHHQQWWVHPRLLVPENMTKVVLQQTAVELTKKDQECFLPVQRYASAGNSYRNVSFLTPNFITKF